MKIQPQQLFSHFSGKIISPLYFVGGDEFLLVREVCDEIRKHANLAGFSQREVFTVEPGFSWEKFLGEINNTSIFGDQALIELHLNSKLSDVGRKILQQYAMSPKKNKILLIISGKIDAQQQKTAWFKAVDAGGVIVQVWPIELSRLPMWIGMHLQQAGLMVDAEGIKILADYSAGNLLAAEQEIKKLQLLFGAGKLTSKQIATAVSDNSRFDVFNLVDAILMGKKALVLRILDNLKNEDVAPPIILWALAREIRMLVSMHFAQENGENIDQVMTRNNVWSSRKALVKKTLIKCTVARLKNLLQHAARIDCITKGANQNNLVWHELFNICESFAA